MSVEIETVQKEIKNVHLSLPIKESLSEEQINQQKKEARKSRYNNWNGELNEDLFSEMKNHLITSIDIDYDKDDYYQGFIKWDEEGITETSSILDISKERLMDIVDNQKTLSYEEIEEILSIDPNFLVSVMTLVTNNYLINSKLIRTEKLEDPSDFEIIPFLFTHKEERLMLMGRTLLVELRDAQYKKGKYSGSLTKLIQDIESIICQFNLLLVKDVAHKNGHFIEFDDAFQAGNTGLLRGLYKFDVDTGNKFSTYAKWWIKQSVKREDYKNRSTVRLPIYMTDKLIIYYNCEKQLTKEGKGHTFEDVIKRMEINEERSISGREKNNIKKAWLANKTVSLDKDNSPNDNDNNLYMIVSSQQTPTEELVIKNQHYEIVQQKIEESNLTTREKKLIELRFGLNGNIAHTLGEISELFSLSQERVRQIETVAMRKLGKETSKIETKKDREFKQLCKEAKLTPLENDIIQLRKGITDGVKYNYT
jgi:RNA polymerase primary sigma factor